MSKSTGSYLDSVKEIARLNGKYEDLHCWDTDKQVEHFVRMNLFQQRILSTKLDKFINSWPEQMSEKLRQIQKEMQEIDIPWL